MRGRRLGLDRSGERTQRACSASRTPGGSAGGELGCMQSRGDGEATGRPAGGFRARAGTHSGGAGGRRQVLTDRHRQTQPTQVLYTEYSSVLPIALAHGEGEEEGGAGGGGRERERKAQKAGRYER